MTPLAIVQAVQAYFKANWTATPAFYDNLPSPKNLPDRWARLSVLPRKPFFREIGQGATGHRNGVVKVQIFTPAGCGVQVGWGLGAQVEALFRGVEVNGVFFAPGDFSDQEGPSTVDSGVTNGNQQHTTTCPFWALDGE